MPNAWKIENTNEDGQRYELTTYPQVQPKIIGPGQYLSLNLTPLLGILKAQKYLPIRYMGGMQLEFTLCNATEALHPLSASRTYQIERAEMRMSVVRLDSALENSFSQLMLQGRALQFHIKTLHLQQQALPASNTEIRVSLVRALSRLAGLFISFCGATDLHERSWRAGREQRGAHTPAQVLHEPFRDHNGRASSSGQRGAHQLAGADRTQKLPRSQPLQQLSRVVQLAAPGRGRVRRVHSHDQH